VSGHPQRQLHDVSIVVRAGTPEWPGDTPFSCRWTWQMAVGASVNVSALEMSPHVGTHADAPLHVRDGLAGSDELPLDAFIGPAIVLGVEGTDGPIDTSALSTRLPRRLERLLLRTGRTIAAGSFPAAWPALTPACVRWLVGRGLKLLGVDAPSVDDRESKTLDTHRALFDGGASIVENLDLRGISDGQYELIALPLRVAGLDAAPVRAVLVEAV
jgi:arylformamidase